jgi:4-amino-4-deoxy-L-arabinose transferase-like glycosyltransferase
MVRVPTMGGVGGDAGMKPGRLRVKFIAAWGLLQLLKLALAASLPLLVDEAFYAWEGQHPAWAYSDLPGLTAWLSGLGVLVGGGHSFALRLPFLLLGACLPWQVWRIAGRIHGEQAAYWAGLLALLMPLSGLLGVLALPDVPLVFASLLCLEAMLALRERVSGAALASLALGLLVGALSHYRFALVLLAGALAFAVDSRLRACLREPRLWLVLAIGALAWWPLLHWNLSHADAGIRFHLVERNPWSFHASGLSWLAIQCLLVTPPLFVLLLASLRECWRRRTEDGPWRLLGVAAALSVPGYFLLGFFADTQRVSFHWPLSGWLVLLAVAPVVLARWQFRSRVLVLSCAALGLALGLGFLLVASSPVLRLRMADQRLYPDNFAGWQELGTLARRLPRDQVWIAGDFEMAAQLAFAGARKDVLVLDSPLNHKHGRSAQLQVWQAGWTPAMTANRPALLLIDDSATPMKLRLRLYQDLCRQFGPLPRAEELSVDRGRKRYLVFRLTAQTAKGECVAPALSWIDQPANKEKDSGKVRVEGWAFKEGVGIAAVDVLVDGQLAAPARYGLPMSKVAEYWQVSRDPNHPWVGFRAEIDSGTLEPGKHWLQLRLHGADGSVETGPAQSLRVQR